jgi:hypothetical protein
MPQQQAANLQEWFWWHSYFTSLCWLTERRTTEIDDDHDTALLLLLGQLGP